MGSPRHSVFMSCVMCCLLYYALASVISSAANGLPASQQGGHIPCFGSNMLWKADAYVSWLLYTCIYLKAILRHCLCWYLNVRVCVHSIHSFKWHNLCASVVMGKKAILLWQNSEKTSWIAYYVQSCYQSTLQVLYEIKIIYNPLQCHNVTYNGCKQFAVWYRTTSHSLTCLSGNMDIQTVTYSTRPWAVWKQVYWWPHERIAAYHIELLPFWAKNIAWSCLQNGCMS